MSPLEALRIRKAYKLLRSHDERLKSPGFRIMLEERNNELGFLLSHRLEKPLSQCRILDFGCGEGDVLDWLHNLGASPELMIGVDLLPESIAKARENYPYLRFEEVDSGELPFPTGGFDIVLTFTVFSSILDPIVAQDVADEVKRVLAYGTGVILWYDMRYPNPWNHNMRPMTLFRIGSLFSGMKAELEPLTLIPPLAERLGPLTEKLYPVLALLPVLRSHYFGALHS